MINQVSALKAIHVMGLRCTSRQPSRTQCHPWLAGTRRGERGVLTNQGSGVEASGLP
jgi:hypothetical protein